MVPLGLARHNVVTAQVAASGRQWLLRHPRSVSGTIASTDWPGLSRCGPQDRVLTSWPGSIAWFIPHPHREGTSTLSRHERGDMANPLSWHGCRCPEGASPRTSRSAHTPTKEARPSAFALEALDPRVQETCGGQPRNAGVGIARTAAPVPSHEGRSCNRLQPRHGARSRHVRARRPSRLPTARTAVEVGPASRGADRCPRVRPSLLQAVYDDAGGPWFPRRVFRHRRP